LLGLILALTLPHGVAFARSEGERQAIEVQLVLDLRGFSSPVRDLAFSSDGTMLAACGGQEVRIWDLRTGRLLRTLRGQIGHDGNGDCLAVAFSHDNCELVVGIRCGDSGAIRVYDIRNIAEIRELLDGFSAAVTQLTFAYGGRFLVVGCEDGSLTVYNWAMQRVVGGLEPGSRPVEDFANIGCPDDSSLLLAYGPQGATVLSVPGC
jgi:WD40 repeat protein